MSMEIIEQLQHEAHEIAGSPAGFLSLLRMLIEETEKISFLAGTDAPRQYIMLLQIYVKAKRLMALYRSDKIQEEIPNYTSLLRQLKESIRVKRAEAREYAAAWIPPDRLKEIKKYAGTHLNTSPTRIKVQPIEGTRHFYFT